MSYNTQVMKRVSVAFICCVLAVMVFAACARQETELKNTVTAYTRLLAEVLASSKSGGLSLFASEKELSRIGSYITFNLKDHRVIINDLESLEFGKVELSDDREIATVVASERWNFHYVDDKTRQRITEDASISYSNTYHLIKTEGRWVVDRVEVKVISSQEAADR